MPHPHTPIPQSPWIRAWLMCQIGTYPIRNGEIHVIGDKTELTPISDRSKITLYYMCIQWIQNTLLLWSQITDIYAIGRKPRYIRNIFFYEA